MCFHRIYLYGGRECRCVFEERGPIYCRREQCGHEDWYALPQDGGCIIQEEVMLQECPYHSPSRGPPPDLPPYDDDDDYDNSPRAISRYVELNIHDQNARDY
jgi:hypothetical protein